MCCTAATRKKILYGFVVVMDVLDVLSDWLFYYDLKVTEKGLVYGPPSENVLVALFAFCIVGTVVFFFDCIALGCSMFRKSGRCNTDVVSLLAVVLGDIPQISINVYLAYCREEPISYFQLVKASVVLVAILVRIIIAIAQCRRDAKKILSKGVKCVKGMLLAVLVVNLALAVCVFVFTQTQRKETGELVFSVPQAVLDDTYDDLRYFENVGVFIHHPDYGSTVNWIHIMSINDIRGQKDASVSCVYRYEKTATHLKFAIWVKKFSQGKAVDSKPPECFEMDLGTKNIAAVNASLCQSSFFVEPTSVHATFIFIPPAMIFRRRIFGDIQVNFKVQANGTCVLYDNLADRVGPIDQPTIHYYRVNETIASATARRHLLLEDGQPRFYRTDQRHLQDIAEVWRTGFGNCESSGNLAPTLNRAIEIDCRGW